MKAIILLTCMAIASADLVASIPRSKSSFGVIIEVMEAISQSSRRVFIKNYPELNPRPGDRDMFAILFKRLEKASQRGVDVVIVHESTREESTFKKWALYNEVKTFNQKTHHGENFSKGIQYAIIDGKVYLIQSPKGNRPMRIRETRVIQKYYKDSLDTMKIIQIEKEDEEFFNFDF